MDRISGSKRRQARKNRLGFWKAFRWGVLFLAAAITMTGPLRKAGAQQSTVNSGTVTSPVSESPLATRVQSAGATGVGKRVLALYYPWYATLAYSRQWRHQDGVEPRNHRMTSHTHYPVGGPYDSNDPEVIDRHLREAQAASIDTLVCSWWGRRDPTDHALRLLLMRAAKTDVKVCVLWEQYSQSNDPLGAHKDMEYLVDTFSKQPAYLTVNGKPVIFAFDRVCKGTSSDEWAKALDEVNQRYAPGILLIGTGHDLADLALWDGLYSLGLIAAMTNQSVIASAHIQHEDCEASILMSRRLHHLSVLGISPGYDDRKPNATSGNPRHTLVNRQDGNLYSALWEQAITDDPDWILINSFNQWHAGTEIEPSVELGDAYLKLTLQFSKRFKQTIAHP